MTKVNFLFKILLVGFSDVGLKSFRYNFQRDSNIDADVKELSSTGEYGIFGLDNWTMIFSLDNFKIKTVFWEPSLEQRHANLISLFYSEAVGSIFIYDITRKETLYNLEKYVQDIKKQEPNSVLLLLGNKKDLQNQRKISFEEGKIFAEKYDFYNFEEVTLLEKGVLNPIIYDFVRKIHNITRK